MLRRVAHGAIEARSDRYTTLARPTLCAEVLHLDPGFVGELSPALPPSTASSESQLSKVDNEVAEATGFEPVVQFPVQRLSKPPP